VHDGQREFPKASGFSADFRTLLCCQGDCGDLAQAPVEVARECALDASACLASGLVGCEQALVVGGCFGVMVDAGEGDDVQGPVQLAVAAAVQSVSSLLSAGGVERAGAGECGEGRFARHAVGVAAGDEQLGGADGSDAAFLEQIGRDLGEDADEPAVDLLYLVAESLDPPAKPAQDAVRRLWA
jgi:hypothetical protein